MAARTASSRKGTTATSSTDAVPSSLWPALSAVLGGTGEPSQANPYAWPAQGHDCVKALLRVGVGVDPDPPDRRHRDAEQEDPGEGAAAAGEELGAAGDQQRDHPEGAVEDRPAAVAESCQGQLVLAA